MSAIRKERIQTSDSRKPMQEASSPADRKPPVRGIVLAGGRSSRMGTDKALLTIGGQPLIRHLCSQLLNVCDEVIVVTAGPGDRKYKKPLADLGKHVRFAADEYGGQGPLAGIHAGLSATPDGYGFVMACDMPRLSVPLFRDMAGRLDGRVEAVMCEGQPFHAFYHHRTAARAEAFLMEGQLRLQAFCRSLDAVTVPPDDSECFRNLNTPEEFEQYVTALPGLSPERRPLDFLSP
ncbi:molybdenum cofactor guanylyltransferase [Cohnella zeiphila]|uniref:Probable molybdenum cofactor guanylyltransferase n=1 Tax=Cohnella zeiphila TaxID=2761120 RepID=A0A7X0SLG1_9BACL|nr:molybdenum cofactor guanylyltransferase [Cohnella zeiphila]MBB6732064.1 molybdenum cofactor guanylyltransferase [Cohnella zeiphila]